MRYLAIPAAVLLALALAVPVLAHHVIEGPCETLTVESHEGTVVRLTPGDLEFGPLGPGEWPTTYVLSPVPAGQYHVTFWVDGKLDIEQDATVEPCPEESPRPTPSVSGSPPPTVPPTPRPTPPATDTAGTSYDPTDLTPLMAMLAAVLVLILIAAVIEHRWPESRDR